jgi:hypothetical protein
MMCPYELGLRKILDMPLTQEEDAFVRAWNQKYERVRERVIQELALSERFSFTPGDRFLETSDDACVAVLKSSMKQAMQTLVSETPSNPPVVGRNKGNL